MADNAFDLYLLINSPKISKNDLIEILDERLNIKEIEELLTDCMYSWEELLSYNDHEIADILYNYNPSESQKLRSKEIFDILQSYWEKFQNLQEDREDRKPFSIANSTIYRKGLETAVILYNQHYPGEDLLDKLKPLVELFWYKFKSSENEFSDYILPNLNDEEKTLLNRLIYITDYHMKQNLGFVKLNRNELFPDLGYTMDELMEYMHILWMEIFVQLELEKRNMPRDDLDK
jgi:hypothetical protein